MFSYQTLDDEDYIAVGLAQCFRLNDDAKLDRKWPRRSICSVADRYCDD